LLFGTAFTCTGKAQEGGSCAIFSAMNLMSHYCSTPSDNAQANTCSTTAPSFRCVTRDEFLAEAKRQGAWEVKACKENKGAGTSECSAVPDNPNAKKESDLQARFDAKCAGGAKTPLCVALAQMIVNARQQGGKGAPVSVKPTVVATKWVSG